VCYGSDSFGQVLRRIACICHQVPKALSLSHPHLMAFPRHQVQQVRLFDCKEIRSARSAVEFSDFKNCQCGIVLNC
jgi:hypothetical protein